MTISMKFCNTIFWMGFSNWLKINAASIQLAPVCIQSVVLPCEAAVYEGLSCGAVGSNVNKRLRAIAVGLVVAATLQGRVEEDDAMAGYMADATPTFCKNWNDVFLTLVEKLRTELATHEQEFDGHTSKRERRRVRV